MAPRRKVSDLRQNSIWDETLVSDVLPNRQQRHRMWQWLLAHPESDLAQVPFDTWSVNRKSATALRSQFVKYTTTVVEQFDSSRGDSTKLLLRLQDGHEIETVVMRHPAHSTVCVSSQIGCQMGCRFCATGTMGIIGNLTSGEIVEQLVRANAITKIRNVVFMGMGEPLNNYDNVKLAIEFMVDCTRFALSPRHVTLSTVGVLKSMRRLTDEMPFVSLALSLHAPNQEVRLKIVPAAAAHKMDQLMAALDYHIEQNKLAYQRNKRNKKTGEFLTSEEVDDAITRCIGKRPNKISGVMIEYILIKDVNDREEHALELANLLSCRREHILLNLIPYNPTAVAEDYEPPSDESVQRFHRICESAPFLLHTRVRQEKGQDIAGACGQLALVKKAADAGSPKSVSAAGNSSSSTAVDIEDYGAAINRGGQSKNIGKATSAAPESSSHLLGTSKGGLKATAALYSGSIPSRSNADEESTSDVVKGSAVAVGRQPSFSQLFKLRSRPFWFCVANIAIAVPLMMLLPNRRKY